MVKRVSSFFIKFIISAGILLIIFSRIKFSFEEFVTTIENIKPLYFIITLICVVVVLAIKTYRWKLIIANLGIHYNYWHAFKAYFSSFTFGIITPGRLGEFVKLYNLREDTSIDSLKGFSTVLSDRLFDLVFLMWLGLSALLYFYFQDFGSPGLKILYLISALVVMIVFFVIFRKATPWLIKKLNPESKTAKLLKFVFNCFAILSNKSSIVLWLVTLIAYVIFYFSLDSIFYAIGIRLAFFDVVMIFSVISIILLMPISVAGFGTREAGLILLLGLYHISPETAITFSVIQFIVYYIWGSMLGGFFLLISPIPFNTMVKDIKKIKRMLF